MDINRAWKSIKQNIRTSDKEYSELLQQRKKAKLQWLWNLSQINGDNLNNVRCETYTILVRKPEGIKPIEIPRQRWGIKLKWILEK
jgi:hypothetical protein